MTFVSYNYTDAPPKQVADLQLSAALSPDDLITPHLFLYAHSLIPPGEEKWRLVSSCW